ncbi:MAG: iron-containing alcohol dehydrogenase [Planctomycetaceae bacterium]
MDRREGHYPTEEGSVFSRQIAALEPFDFDPRTRVVFGPGTIARLGELARDLGGSRVLLVTDKGLADAGHEQRALDVLAAAKMKATVFDGVHANPTTLDVNRGLDVAKRANIDLIVGLGGGSSMDCAKGVNFLLTNGGRIEDYAGFGKATRAMLPMIAVPTTAGTGSEAQSFALIADPHTHMKMACGDKKAACRVAILDSDLTSSMPASVAAATGIDAISHAIETFVTTARNPISQLFSSRAWKLLRPGFPRVMSVPRDAAARGAMLLGAHLAGAAIENSMLGAAHSLANPLSAHFDITHGIAVGVMLPHVVRFNAEVVGELYGRLAADAELCDADDPEAASYLASHLESLMALSGLPTWLEQCDVDPSMFDRLADEAAAQWTRKFNPRPIDRDDLRELYQCAYAA